MRCEHVLQSRGLQRLLDVGEVRARRSILDCPVRRLVDQRLVQDQIGGSVRLVLLEPLPWKDVMRIDLSVLDLLGSRSPLSVKKSFARSTEGDRHDRSVERSSPGGGYQQLIRIEEVSTDYIGLGAAVKPFLDLDDVAGSLTIGGAVI